MEIAAIFPFLFVAGAMLFTIYIGCVVSLFRHPKGFLPSALLVMTTAIFAFFFFRLGFPLGLMISIAFVAIAILALTRRAEPQAPE